MRSNVPKIRVRELGEKPVNADGKFILYWMIANRRTTWNYSLQRAIDWCQELGKPLVVLEALRCDYQWASDRLHAFVIQGMIDNADRLDRAGVSYLPYIEPAKRQGSGLLKTLARDACAVVSDDFPCFFLPAMLRAAARQVDARFELVDSNGMLPMRAADKVYSRAYDLRRFLQKNLRPYLSTAPSADPLDGVEFPRAWSISDEVTENWKPTDLSTYQDSLEPLADLPIDHEVQPAPDQGGEHAGSECLERFMQRRFERYGEDRNQPEENVASELSPYLHFGHISVHEVFSAVRSHEGWTPDDLSEKTGGARAGWWGMSETAESFLDELITWRELGYNMCWQQSDYDKYESLPEWARDTLEEHASDEREHIYSLQEFEESQTHDDLWNAAQRQLVVEGRIHNYLRMLWGKKILEWTEHPRDALKVMIELNNKYALDGRNPNSYSGIFWVLGRYDRAWGPERPIFGKIRYMTSENTARKVKVKNYIEKYSVERQGQLFH